MVKYKQERQYLWTAIICMLLVFSALFFYTFHLLSKDKTIYIEEEQCYNETRPYSTQRIKPLETNFWGSGKGDRFEITDYGIDEKAIMELEKRNIEIRIPPFDESLIEYDVRKSPFGWYNGNSYHWIDLRVYENPPKEVCEMVKIPIEIGDLK